MLKIKNISGEILQLHLHEFQIDEIYTTEVCDRESWANNDDTLAAITSAKIQIYDGDTAVSGISAQIDFLKGNISSVIIADAKKNRDGAPIIDTGFRRGIPGEDGFTIVSPDFTDRTTWYQNADFITGETLVNAGDNLNYQAAAGKRHWVNISSDKLTYDHNKLLLSDGTLGKEQNYLVKVYANGIAVSEGFTIDYANGRVTFTASQEGKTITSDFAHNDKTGSSEFLVRPLDGYKFLIEHVEIQFSKNMNFNGSQIIMEVWAGDPSYLNYGDFSDELFHYCWGQYSDCLFRALKEGMDWTKAAAFDELAVEFDGVSTVAATLMAFNAAHPGYEVVCAMGDDSQVAPVGYVQLFGGFGIERSVYRSIRDLINWCNNQYPIVPACGEFTHDILCFPFRYLIPAEIKESDGALIRFALKDDIPLVGEISTVTFYMVKIPA